MTHYWHIFHWFSCQFTDYTQNWHMTDTFYQDSWCQWEAYTKIDTSVTHFPFIVVSIYYLHKNWHNIDTFSIESCVNLQITHKIDTWLTHSFPDSWCEWEGYTKIDSFLTRFWDSLPLASIFQNVSRCVKYVKCVSCVNHQADTSIDTADTCVNNVSVFHTWCLTVNLGTGSSKNRKSILTVCVTRQKSGSTDARS